ncbi:fibrillin-2-like isoform x23 [Plakobranchus ocellatus]|uniref:Fibrillin-2-like isoform x23 n=1 Tax=Plakobranchus ocellatus TaxID=259542 RepID=A0AAV3XYE0_9GAST|nr:fibrillin-2-like isoform x23 [Plakobranchus ocellatus]
MQFHFRSVLFIPSHSTLDQRDVNECEKSTNQCPGPCINLAGSYRCDCNITGFTQSEAPDHCNDIDECAENNGGCDDVCINKRGTFECRCNAKGRKLGENGRSCVDVDECSRYKSKVCAHGRCVNNDGSYTCVCSSGYTQADNKSKCVDVNECHQNNGGCMQSCENLPGSYRCTCNSGYVVNGADKSKCEDVDECATNNGGCEDACTNTMGSFTCRCTHVGKILSADNRTCEACSPRQFYNTTSSTCVDCPLHSTARDGLALSVNDCACDPGFHGSPKMQVECQDTNECQTGKMACSHECVNTVGSAHCACPLGFNLDEDQSTCIDVDECSLSSHNCSHVCHNTEGSYTCSCHVGYTQVNNTGECQDINECDMGLGICEHGCNNTEGSYTCACRTGFKLSDNLMTCEDIDECKQTVSPCGHKCINTEGSFRCECEGAGFKLSRDMSSCIDINECMEGDNPCPDICVNTVGSFVCDCNRPGYLLASDGSGCEDIDECAQTPSPCPHSCVNTPGSYRCLCPPGHSDPPEHNQTLCPECGYGTYRGAGDDKCVSCPPKSNTTARGRTSAKDCVCVAGYTRDPYGPDYCKDVDECRIRALQCEHACVNTPGSAHCTCRPGFMLSKADNVSCVDSDECAMHNGGCEHICVNTPGSFHCKCRGRNYKLTANGLSCEDVNACASRKHGCEYKCVNTRYGAKCTCPPGQKLMRDGKKCKDIDECKSRNGGCTDTCINTPGSYRCECNIPGYRLYHDGRQCTDEDECDATGPMGSGRESKACEDVCVNTIGSFTCHCRRPGFELAMDKRSCADIDECASASICQHRCINLPGSFRCDCHAGYYKQGHRCSPCSKGSYRGLRESVLGCELCPPGMTTARKASESIHECKCPKGFDGNPETRDKCRDVNECAQNNGGCAHECQNTRGSFTCSCRPGYVLGADNRSCSPTKCPLLKPPKFAKFKSAGCTDMENGQHVEPGTMCEYKCRGFLMLEGSQNRTCLSNYTWTGSQPKCDALPCERLPVPENGYLHPPVCMLPRVPFRTRCLIKCKRGYRRKGQRAAKCKANMRWSGKIHRQRESTVCERWGSAAKKGKGRDKKRRTWASARLRSSSKRTKWSKKKSAKTAAKKPKKQSKKQKK